MLCLKEVSNLGEIQIRPFSLQKRDESKIGTRSTTRLTTQRRRNFGRTSNCDSSDYTDATFLWLDSRKLVHSPPQATLYKQSSASFSRLGD